MLKFERKDYRFSVEWGTLVKRRIRYIQVSNGVIGLDAFRLESPSDLAELRRVLDEAEEVAGWKVNAQ